MGEMVRYISDKETIWRILNFKNHKNHSMAVHHSIHLQNVQKIYFTRLIAGECSEIA